MKSELHRLAEDSGHFELGRDLADLRHAMAEVYVGHFDEDYNPM